jgi:hypothetical protein
MPDTTDSYFNLTLGASPVRTEARRKDNTTSIYLNLTNSNGTSVTVQILRGNSGSCTINDRLHVVQPGKKYMLFNDVQESGFSYVQLEFTGPAGQQIQGRWSPDSVPETGCSILK